ncbi:epithelial-stromal interaction protein 1 isoform X4 [Phyllopteryx taeniolatus]|uniref:epithelial-stromal interaction protein 1 isoform X4 n=1 Tax=Phyllopteryx taeniolatus TaxID=161469 RepID=UPI002AD42D4E|nr:epithelial-stromal interaction protein 1 isoform X4 [Phyllopteryx taeniolatus]
MDPNGHEVKHCSNANNPTRDPIDNNMATRTKYLGGVTVISPIESRRNEMRMSKLAYPYVLIIIPPFLTVFFFGGGNVLVAEKEEEELQKLKEALRLTHVHTTPQRLGGDATLAQVRERQSADLRCSKMQKKLKQETLAQKKRKEEEDELQWKKDEHRKKAERLEERKKAEQQRRREDLQQDHAQDGHLGCGVHRNVICIFKCGRGQGGVGRSDTCAHFHVDWNVRRERARIRERKSPYMRPQLR